MLRVSSIISLVQTAFSTSSLRGTSVDVESFPFVTSPCGGQSLSDILELHLTCDGRVFVPPAGVRFGFYNYETGALVERHIVALRRYHFEHQVSKDTQDMVLSSQEDFDLYTNPFKVPREIIISNGGVCIPFGTRYDVDDG